MGNAFATLIAAASFVAPPTPVIVPHALPSQTGRLSKLEESSPLTIKPGEIGSGKIYVPCSFDGLAQPCFLDTGATGTEAVDAAFFKNYPVTGKVHFKSAAGIEKEADEIEIETLRLGAFSRHKVKVARLDPAEGFESTVGIDVFADQALLFQFGDQPSLTLGAIVPNASVGLKIHNKGIFSIPIEVDHAATRGLWDTGAGLTAIDRDYVTAHPRDFTFIADIPNGHDGAGNPVTIKLYKAANIKVGERAFANIEVLAIDFSVVRKYVSKDIRLIIGFNLINHADWFFDLQRRTWAIQ